MSFIQYTYLYHLKNVLKPVMSTYFTIKIYMFKTFAGVYIFQKNSPLPKLFFPQEDTVQTEVKYTFFSPKGEMFFDSLILFSSVFRYPFLTWENYTVAQSSSYTVVRETYTVAWEHLGRGRGVVEIFNPLLLKMTVFLKTKQYVKVFCEIFERVSVKNIFQSIFPLKPKFFFFKNIHFGLFLFQRPKYVYI